MVPGMPLAPGTPLESGVPLADVVGPLLTVVFMIGEGIDALVIVTGGVVGVDRLGGAMLTLEPEGAVTVGLPGGKVIVGRPATLLHVLSKASCVVITTRKEDKRMELTVYEALR